MTFPYRGDIRMDADKLAAATQPPSPSAAARQAAVELIAKLQHEPVDPLDDDIVPTALALDAYAAQAVAAERVAQAAQHHLASRPAPCPKCGVDCGLIGRCAAEDCPSTEARLERFRESIDADKCEYGYYHSIGCPHHREAAERAKPAAGDYEAALRLKAELPHISYSREWLAKVAAALAERGERERERAAKIAEHYQDLEDVALGIPAAIRNQTGD